MKHFILFLFLIFTGTSAFSQLFSFEYDGIERSYYLHVPVGYNPDNQHPLVFNLHGLGSNSTEQFAYSGFYKVSDTANIIVVYPNAVNKQWNVYSDEGVDDVGFISALIDTMAAQYNIDLRKVYSTGMSMGGFMSYRLACQLNDRIAAIASVTGVLAYPNCMPGRSFPILQIHGTDDQTVPYNLVPPTIKFWVDQNKCSDTTVMDLPDIDTTDNSTVTKTIYAPCNDDVEVILYTVHGGGHTWPGSEIDIGSTNYDINASVEIWNFFLQYTLPETVGLEEKLFSENKLLIYPQPIINTAILKIPVESSQSWRLRLFDFSGREIRNENAGFGMQVSFSRNGLKSGMYIIELSSDKFVYRKKVMFR